MHTYASYHRALTVQEKKAKEADPNLLQTGNWAPQQWQDDLAFWRACYAAEVRRVDRYVGEFYKEIQEHPAWEDTTLIVVGDHGEELLDQGGWGHGNRLNWATLNIPFLLRLPGSRHSGMHVAETVSHVDILPTLLELIQYRQGILPGFQGVSLLSLIKDRSWNPRPVFSSGSYGYPDSIAVFIGRHKLISGEGPGVSML